jgi:hypothetical protein
MRKEIDLKFGIGDEVFYLTPNMTGMNVGIDSFIVHAIKIFLDNNDSIHVDYYSLDGKVSSEYFLFGTKKEVKEFVKNQIENW